MFHKILLSVCASLVFFSKTTLSMEPTEVINAGFKSARELFHLPTTGTSPLQYGIPINLKTGISEEFFDEQSPTQAINLDNYDDIISSTGMTIPQIFDVFPPQQWEDMFPLLNSISFVERYKYGADTFLEWSKQFQAKAFLLSLYSAFTFLPENIVQECPAMLIAKCDFYKNDPNLAKALKFQKLGLLLKDATNISENKSFSLSAESFQIAAAFFESCAVEANNSQQETYNPYAAIDYYVSALQCHTWAAVRYPDIFLSRQEIHKTKEIFDLGYEQLRTGFRELRRAQAYLSEEELTAIKKDLCGYTKALVKWAKDYDLDRYKKLRVIFKA